MAILGGGNPVGGSNPAGIGSSLNYIGDHAFAYSGIVSVGSAGQDTPSTLLDFTTGREYIVAKMHAMRGYTANEAHNYLWLVKLNGETIYEFFDSNADFNENPIHLLIPSFSRVEITTQNSSAATDNNVGFTVLGRVYT